MNDSDDADTPVNSPAVEKAITRFHKRLGELRAWHCGRGCPSGDVCEVVKFGRSGACEGAYGVRGLCDACDTPTMCWPNGCGGKTSTGTDDAGKDLS